MYRWQTDFLFAQPGALAGAGSVLDLWGLFDSYNISQTVAQADAKAILNDWHNVGSDLKDAMKNVAKK